MRVPRHVVEERPASELQAERLDEERWLGEDQVILGRRERMHVGRSRGLQRRQRHSLPGSIGHRMQVVDGLRAEGRDVVVVSLARLVVVRVGGCELSHDVIRMHERAEALERVGVEADPVRRLGHRHPAPPEGSDVHARVVALRASSQEGRDPAPDLPQQSHSLLRTRERLAAKKAGAELGRVTELESNQERETLEPVHTLCAGHLEERRPRANERTSKPGGDLSLNLHGSFRVLGGLVREESRVMTRHWTPLLPLLIDTTAPVRRKAVLLQNQPITRMSSPRLPRTSVGFTTTTTPGIPGHS